MTFPYVGYRFPIFSLDILLFLICSHHVHIFLNISQHFPHESPLPNLVRPMVNRWRQHQAAQSLGSPLAFQLQCLRMLLDVVGHLAYAKSPFSIIKFESIIKKWMETGIFHSYSRLPEAMRRFFVLSLSLSLSLFLPFWSFLGVQGVPVRAGLATLASPKSAPDYQHAWARMPRCAAMRTQYLLTILGRDLTGIYRYCGEYSGVGGKHIYIYININIYIYILYIYQYINISIGIRVRIWGEGSHLASFKQKLVGFWQPLQNRSVFRNWALTKSIGF